MDNTRKIALRIFCSMLKNPSTTSANTHFEMLNNSISLAEEFTENNYYRTKELLKSNNLIK